MIKRTLYFGHPAYLYSRMQQLLIEQPDKNEPIAVPIEDIGLVILDHGQITVTQTVLSRLLEQNVAVVTCDDTHHPAGMLLNLEGHSLQSQRFQLQADASIPLKKQLWQQTISQKISNQAASLEKIRQEAGVLKTLAKTVKSGDADNVEAQAASFYWKRFFPDFLEFTRERFGPPPNNLLNYGYAILRAMVARALIGSGLLPTLGIHHRNQYNAFCLADDIMEPYRPFVDQVVYQLVRQNGKYLEMTPTMKQALLSIPVLDVKLDGKKSPMMNAISRTTNSLAACYEGSARKILYPVLA
jgi:CRISPR-associated protein Cas1